VGVPAIVVLFNVFDELVLACVFCCSVASLPNIPSVLIIIILAGAVQQYVNAAVAYSGVDELPRYFSSDVYL